jgi:glutaminyl-peptide cyclotransferase
MNRVEIKSNKLDGNSPLQRGFCAKAKGVRGMFFSDINGGLLLSSISIVVILICSGCNGGEPKKQVFTADTVAKKPVSTPAFDADSAYDYVGRQVAFGPRTPGSAAQTQCAAWMDARLKNVCDTVYRQETHVTGGDGKSLPCINLIGVINPKATKRILFLTHWDSRPWADQDTHDADKPILAADDGGSGVGVLLEMARDVKAHGLPDNIGIDILLTDVEDYGKTQWGDISYCLGTQYWARHPHVAGYKADFGILLDMVGARGAQFPMEGISTQYAGDIQQKVWQAAANAGYSSFFPYAASADITDDHVPVNKLTGIKTIDIINLTPDPEKPFAPHWHTHADAMNIIDKSTLKAVGQTLLQVIYETAQQSTTSLYNFNRQKSIDGLPLRA